MSAEPYLTPHEIVVLGFRALVEKLGPGGAVRFMLHYEAGEGDYTSERRSLLSDVTLKTLETEMRPSD
jgi:hypothetical protein